MSPSRGLFLKKAEKIKTNQQIENINWKLLGGLSLWLAQGY